MYNVKLPIGIEGPDGTRYRDVVIDEMCGLEEEVLASSDLRDSPSKMNTMLIRRILQEVPGLLPAKSSTTELVDENFVRDMYQADRDELVIAMLKQSLAEPTRVVRPICTNCGVAQAPVTLDLRKLVSTEWPAHEKAGFKVDLPHGATEGSRTYKTGWYRFPRGSDFEAASDGCDNVQIIMSKMYAQCLTMDDPGCIFDFELARRLLKRDRDYLALKLMDVLPGTKPTSSKPCVHCHADVITVLRVTDFFDPIRD